MHYVVFSVKMKASFCLCYSFIYLYVNLTAEVQTDIFNRIDYECFSKIMKMFRHIIVIAVNNMSKCIVCGKRRMI